MNIGIFIGIGSSRPAAPPEEIPVITGVPTISGTASVPNTLTVTPASASGGGITNTYQWKRDGANIGGATGVTYDLVTADAGTDITVVQTATNTAGSDSAESAATTIAFIPEAFGIIHSDNFDSGTLTPYTQTGSKFTATGSNLRISTTTGGHGEYLRVTTPNIASAHATHMLEKWKMSATFVAPASGGTNYGFGLGVRSTNGFTTLSTSVRIAFDAALPKGSVYFYEHNNGVVSQTSQNSAFSPVTSTTYIFEVERNKNVYTARLKSADGLTTHYSLSRTFSLSNSSAGWINNVGNFCIWAYGGTNLDITNLTIETSALKYAELLGAGDSNMWGAWAGSNATRYVEQAATDAGLQFEICAGVDAGINDVPLTSIIALQPQKIYVNIGSNDEANGVADATWKSRLDTMFSTLSASGYNSSNVIIGIPCARNGVDIAAIKTYLDTNYSSYTRVDLYTTTKQPANTSLQVAYNGGDNIHMSAAGNNACAAVLEPIITP